MSKIGIAVTALAASLTLGVTAASAQAWGYDQYQAERAYKSAADRDAEAGRDQRLARVAAWYGDYRTADHFARAAQHRRDQAWRDARYAQHERNAAHWDYRYGRWVY